MNHRSEGDTMRPRSIRLDARGRGVVTLIALIGFAIGLLTFLLRHRDAALGPADGFDLPAVDTGRVAVGDEAPDFSLRTMAGETLTLSRLRGEQNVVLAFYRGHW